MLVALLGCGPDAAPATDSYRSSAAIDQPTPPDANPAVELQQSAPPETITVEIEQPTAEYLEFRRLFEAENGPTRALKDDEPVPVEGTGSPLRPH